MKKILVGVFFALFLTVSMCLFNVSAIDTSGTCGDDITWTFEKETSTLYLSGSGPMKDYKIAGAPWYHVFQWDYYIKAIVISEGITSIGEFAFYNTDKLISVSFPSSLKKIGYGSFEDCDNLTSITLNEGITLINSRAFRSCNKLKDIFFPNSLKTIGYVAFSETAITSVTLGENLKTVYGSAFSSCKQLEEVNLFTENLTTIHDETHGSCIEGSGMDGISINIMSDVESIPADFTSNYNINVKRYNVDNNNRSFYHGNTWELFDKNDTLLQVPRQLVQYKWYIIPPETKTVATKAFSYSKIETIYFPEGSKISVESMAFYNCDFLDRVYLWGIVDSTESVFPCDVEVSDLSMYCNIISTSSICRGDIYYNGNLLTNLIIPDDVRQISNWRFASQEAIKSVTLPKGVEKVEEYAFNACKNLSAVYILDSKTIIDDAFGSYSPSNLKDIYYAGTEEQWKEIVGWHESEYKYITIHFNFSGEEPEDDTGYLYTIHAYSNKPNLITGENGSLEMTAQLNAIPVQGDPYMKSGASFSFTSSDNEIFTIENIDAQSNKTTVTLNGQHSGTAVLSVSAYFNGEFKAANQFRISVAGETVYFAEAMPTFNDYNIECNGITIDNFKYDKTNVDSCTISFDAYNQMNCYGAVEVYDKNGTMLYTQSIDRFDGMLLPDSAVDMFKEAFSAHLYNCDYKNEEYSEKTEIYLQGVPRDGHIVISNDILNSQACAIYNVSNLAIETVLQGIKLSKFLDDEEVEKEVTQTLGQMVLETALKTADKTLDKTYKSLLKDVFSKSNFGTRAGMNRVLDSYILFLDQIDIDLGQMILDTLKKSLGKAAFGVIEKAVLDLMGVPGKVIDKAFDLISVNNLLQQGATVGENTNSGKTNIYCSTPYNNVRYSNGFVVRGNSSFDETASFHTYKIVDTRKYDEVQQKFDEKIVQLFAMSLYEGGKEVQPTGNVTVAIPVPEGINVFHMNVYREEADGTFTKLKFYGKDDGYTLDDGYIYITTEHFSLYCIAGDAEEIQNISFAQPNIEITVNDSFVQYPTFLPEISDELLGDWNWTSSNEAVAKITGNGIVFAVGEGTTTISALNGSVSYTVNVLPHPHTYTSAVTTPATCTEPGVMTYACACGENYTETIPALGHIDEGNDGYCDRCGEMMTGGDHCRYCGKIHGGLFGWLVQIFHNILAIFKR